MHKSQLNLLITKQLVLTFDEFVSGQVDEETFAVKSQDRVDKSYKSYDIANAKINKKTVTLTLSTPVDYAEDVVTLTYTAGGLTDEFGNKIASITR